MSGLWGTPHRALLAVILFAFLEVAVGEGYKTGAVAQGEENKHWLTPERMDLFAKAIYKIVESGCPNVDHFQLDSFQAYVNRQILSGETEKLRHFGDFYNLYQNLTGCAHHLVSVNGVTEEIGEKEDSSKERVINDGKTSLEYYPEEGGDIQDEENGGIHNEPKLSAGRKNVKEKKEGERTPNEEKTEAYTVVDRIVHNATVVALDFASKAKKAAIDYYAQASIIISNWFGKRKKREVPQEGENIEGKIRFYSREPFTKINHIEKEENPNLQEYILSEAGKVGQSHFTHMLKYFVELVVDGCADEFKIEKKLLTMIAKLIVLQVSKDLEYLSEVGMFIRVNEGLEKEVLKCVKKD